MDLAAIAVQTWGQMRPGTKNVKRYLRFTASVDDELRHRAKFMGDLSRFVEAALTATNLATVELTEDAPRRGAQIIVRLSPATDKKLSATAKRRDCSITTLANSALVDWLGKTPK